MCLLFLQPGLELINPTYIIKLFYRWILRIKGKYLDLTQYEAQLWYLSTNGNIDRVYSYYINIIMFSMCYICMFPLGTFIGGAALVVHYLVEKVVLKFILI
jgi:hypothetical protein